MFERKPLIFDPVISARYASFRVNAGIDLSDVKDFPGA